MPENFAATLAITVIMVSYQGLIYAKMIQQFFAVAGILTGYDSHGLQCLNGARHHITQIANGCGDNVQRTGLI